MVHLLHRLYGVDAPVRGCAKHLLHLLIPVLGLCHTSNGASDHAHNTRSTTLQFPRQLWGNWILVQHETLEVAVVTMRTLKVCKAAAITVSNTPSPSCYRLDVLLITQSTTNLRQRTNRP